MFPSRLLSVGVAALLLSVAAAASPPMPPMWEDSASRVRDDLEVIAREYSYFTDPSDSQLTVISDQLDVMQERCRRLGSKDNPEIKVLLGVIAASRQIVMQRRKLEEERRKSEATAYVFHAISGPTEQDGGYSQQGADYLAREVDEFVGHYRALKRQRQADSEGYVDQSRAYFRRTIQNSMETAERQLKNGKWVKGVTDLPRGSLAYDHSTPQQNLRWALAVARIAEDFELKVGGSPEKWRELQTKIWNLAANYKVTLTPVSPSVNGPFARSE